MNKLPYRDNMPEQQFIAKLVEILGKNKVLYDEKSKQIYGKDFSQKYNSLPAAITFPESEEEIVSIVRFANETQTALVPSGGRTGYSGGATAQSQEVVVSFEKFNHMLEINTTDKQIKCDPGVITKKIQELAFENNLYYPVDFASAGTSQIGGNVATNAGGIRVIRYGSTRNWISGLKVVTGNGDVLNLNSGLIKNTAGYDLRQLYIGSEGTLGFITEVTLQLTVPPKESKVLLIAIENKNYFIKLLEIFNPILEITAFEFFSQPAINYVIQETHSEHPFKSPTSYYVLLEYESDTTSDDACIGITQKLINSKIISDAILSHTMEQSKKLWRFREEISMSILKHSPYKYDIAVLPSKIPAFIQEVDELFTSIFPDMEAIWFGHIGDGNMHLNILKPPTLAQENFISYCNEMSHRLYKLIQKYNGTISAEHGVGLLKKDFLRYSKSEMDINYMRSIKKIFDKNNIMNPGKIL